MFVAPGPIPKGVFCTLMSGWSRIGKPQADTPLAIDLP
jgi:hypothetical protein